MAISIIEEVTGETIIPKQPQPEAPPKNPHAQALAQLGASKGGKARAAKLTADQRREIARKAATKRWAVEEEPAPS